MKSSLFVATTILALLPASAEAYDWSVVAHVNNIEVTYMPAKLPFYIDVAGGSCSAGVPLVWNIHGADDTQRAQNAQATLAALMTAQATGHSIVIYGNNNGCTIDYLYTDKD